LNTWKLPKGVQVKTFYDRTVLIHTTIETVTDILISGVGLVFLILFLFLGNLRAALIVALTIPLSLTFTFAMMVLLGQSANLISLGAIDFGIIVDATLIMVESIFYHLTHGVGPLLAPPQKIIRAARQVGRPIFFSTAIIALQSLGGEFMPALEEGNLWVRATMPVDISFDQASRLATEIRGIFRRLPEVSSVVSQLGRPDDGTDPTSFFNAEFLVALKPAKEWRAEVTSKEKLIEDAEAILSRIPGVTFNFSQMIQDNVQEAMSGVKGENSIKLFGPDLKVLEGTAVEIERVMKQVPGVKDLGILRLMGQPNLMIRVDREACARYGLLVSDVNAVVQAAIGGQAVTRVFEGERWFDLVVRFQPEYRQDIET